MYFTIPRYVAKHYTPHKCPNCPGIRHTGRTRTFWYGMKQVPANRQRLTDICPRLQNHQLPVFLIHEELWTAADPGPRRLDIHVEPQIFYRASRSIIFWKVLCISRREMVFSLLVLRNSRRIYVFSGLSYVISSRYYVSLAHAPQKQMLFVILSDISV